MTIRSELISQLQNKGMNVDTLLNGEDKQNVSLFKLVDLVAKIPSKYNIEISKTPEVLYSPDTIDNYKLVHLEELIQNLQIRLSNTLLIKGITDITYMTSLTKLIEKIQYIELALPVTIEIVTAPQSLNINEQSTISAKLSSDTTILSDKTVVLKCDNVKIGPQTQKTNSKGVATFVISSTDAGTFKYTVEFTSINEYASQTLDINITYKKLTTTIIQSVPDTIQAYTDFTITATLGQKINDGTITIHIGNDKYTGTPIDGVFSKTITKEVYSVGTYSIYVEWSGDDTYQQLQTISKTVSIQKSNSSINFNLKNSTISLANQASTTITASGIGEIYLYDKINGTNTLITHAPNSVSVTRSFTDGTHTITAISSGNQSYNGDIATGTIYAYTSIPVNTSLSPSQGSITLGQSITLYASVSPSVLGTVTFKDNQNRLNQTVSLSNGNATISYTPANTSNNTFYAQFNNSGVYYANNQANTSISINEPISYAKPTLNITYNSNDLYYKKTCTFTITSNVSGLSYSVDGSNINGNTFSKTFSSAGNITINVKQVGSIQTGNTIYTGGSASITITINKLPIYITPTSDDSWVTSSVDKYGWNYYIRATTIDGAPLSGLTFFWVFSSGHSGYVTCDTNGYIGIGLRGTTNHTYNFDISRDEDNNYLYTSLHRQITIKY
jgi:hypothetical protein